MPSMIVKFDEEYDKKLKKLAIDRDIKNKNLLVEEIVREYIDKRET